MLPATIRVRDESNNPVAKLLVEAERMAAWCRRHAADGGGDIREDVGTEHRRTAEVVVAAGKDRQGACGAGPVFEGEDELRADTGVLMIGRDAAVP
jgi:hypothetical protein